MRVPNRSDVAVYAGTKHGYSSLCHLGFLEPKLAKKVIKDNYLDEHSRGAAFIRINKRGKIKEYELVLSGNAYSYHRLIVLSPEKDFDKLERALR